MMINARSIIMTCCSLVMSVGAPLAAYNGVRAYSPAEEMDIHEKRLHLMPEAVKNSPSVHHLLTTQYYNDNPYLSNLHPYSFYSMVELTVTGDQVKLQDGSIWNVKPSDRYIVKSWKQDHQLFIKPNASCFPYYHYVLYNRTVNQVAEINYRELSEPFYPSTVRLIGSIDSVHGLITLRDGTVLRMNPKDLSYANWWIEDRVLVGTNNNWRSSEYPLILINASFVNTPYCECYAY